MYTNFVITWDDIVEEIFVINERPQQSFQIGKKQLETYNSLSEKQKRCGYFYKTKTFIL